MVQGAEETSHQRLVRKHIPAWVISGAVHVALIATLILVDRLVPKVVVGDDVRHRDRRRPDDIEKEQVPVDLTEQDLGLIPELPPAVESEKLGKNNIDNPNLDTDPGVLIAPGAVERDVMPPPGIGTPSLTPGADGDNKGLAVPGAGTGASGVMANPSLLGRSGETKSRLLRDNGGSPESEAAVARGLIWLAKQQRANGSWVYDGSSGGDTCAATGMGLLPFLAAGQTHKVSKDNKYNKNVEGGLKFLINNQKPDGSFNQSTGMYSHAIATVALCEALGMTGDRSNLLGPTQRAVNYIVKGQGANGSWGYSAGANGDTSIVGWQIQALQSAKLCKDLVVPKETFAKASKFLDSVQTGSGSQYGYNSPGATPTLTAVGLLCRYYANGWGPNNPGMAKGVGYLLNTWKPTPARMDMYYYYYATQVLHFFEGAEWHRDWNPAMRDMLVKLQVPADKPALSGSWDPDSSWFGPHYGRLGQTCMSLLTLEVYYRHLPLYKRDNAGLKELERVR
ncbi:hypothetical protein FRUB_08583 [Fimbriiglobus ruber]|uniref:Squalene cyclase C-terminal domain-containing protein n=1 Tax=Fimbriiglobus ruber TaxID=1908690 RepID=A0A225D355_9BACT|nr:hypothetical protein FRUB_08583 [Fimbriiglobus ruber]